MAITIAQTSTPGSATGTSASTTFASGTATGNGIVVLLSMNGTPTSVSDDQGNTYNQVGLQDQFGIIAAIYRCDNPTGPVATVTVNFAGSQTVDVIQAVEVFGQLTLDASNGNKGNNSTQDAGAITTSVANTVAFIAVKTSNSPSLPSGYTNLTDANPYRFSYRVYTATQTGVTPSWTVSVSNQFAAVIAAFTSTVTADPRVWNPPAARAVPPPVPPPPPDARPYPAGLLPGFPSPPDPTRRAKELDFIEPNPRVEPVRGARIANKLSVRINSLVRRGELVRVDNEVWALRSGGHAIARPPTTLDDVTTGIAVGQTWVDTALKDAYVCVDNTAGAAVWKKVS